MFGVRTLRVRIIEHAVHISNSAGCLVSLVNLDWHLNHIGWIVRIRSLIRPFRVVLLFRWRHVRFVLGHNRPPGFG